jgi:hypothetical protein
MSLRPQVAMMAMRMSDLALQTAFRTGIPTLAIVAGIFINNSRLNAFRAHMEASFDALLRDRDFRKR